MGIRPRLPESAWLAAAERGPGFTAAHIERAASPSEYGPLLDGGVHRPSVPDPALTRANGLRILQIPALHLQLYLLQYSSTGPLYRRRAP